LVAERLKEKDCAPGFILDGFPRTIPQAEGLEAILQGMGVGLQSVLLVQVPHNIIIGRLAGRRTCKNCGALYHLNFNPSTKERVCDRCGGELVQREDDREETISARLKVYANQTAPLIDYYRQRGLLREIDGVGKVEEIRHRLIKVLEDGAA
jgi:adenylate kinase